MCIDFDKLLTFIFVNTESGYRWLIGSALVILLLGYDGPLQFLGRHGQLMMNMVDRAGLENNRSISVPARPPPPTLSISDSVPPITHPIEGLRNLCAL